MLNLNLLYNRKRTLKRIVQQVNTTILAWSEHQKPKTDGIFASGSLPPLYQIMAYKGEAILLGRFFGVVRQQIGIEMSHRDYLKFWQHCTEEHGFLLDFISRTEWLKVLQINTNLQRMTNAQAKSLYCILLAVIDERSPQQLSLACDEVFIHLYKQQFPESISKKKITNSDQLRHKLAHQIRSITNKPCEIKESFQQEEQSVIFNLLYRVDKKQHWQTLITVERPRLKTARLFAYQSLLESDLNQILNPTYQLKSNKIIEIKFDL